MGQVHRVALAHAIRYGDEIASRQRRPHGRSRRQRHGGIGRDHPHRPYPLVADRLEQRNRLEPRPGREVRRVPIGPQRRNLVRPVPLEMPCQHVCQRAHLAPAHCVRLPGHAERPRPRLADPPGEQVNVDDCVRLVGPSRGLVHALAEHRHGPGRRREPAVERGKRRLIQPAQRSRFRQGRHDRQRRRRIASVIGEEFEVRAAEIPQITQQPRE